MGRAAGLQSIFPIFLGGLGLGFRVWGGGVPKLGPPLLGMWGFPKIRGSILEGFLS